jgi:hypothetical protein
MTRTVRDMIGDDSFLGNPGGILAAVGGAQPPAKSFGQIGGIPLGARTGAPPWARFKSILIAPTGANGGPTIVAEADVQSRIITITAPLVGFTIYIGADNVKVGDFALPRGLPYDCPVPGGQFVYAVTDAPVYLPLQVQIGALLIGDSERRY